MLNIEIINNKIAVIKVKDYNISDKFRYEIFGNNGYNINGVVNTNKNINPNICFEYNLNEIYFIKIIKNNNISYNKFFNPQDKNLNTKIFVNNINMKIEKSYLETDIDKESSQNDNGNDKESSQNAEDNGDDNDGNADDNGEDNDEDNDDESDNDKPEIISLDDIKNM
tara:strand:+ start:60 stop:563 length:504 start_codon:yes stop_codon:yes gene_type:complete